MSCQNAATIPKALVPNPLPNQLLFLAVRHPTDWVAPFPRSQHPPPPPLKCLHTPSSPPHSPSLYTWMRVGGAIIITKNGKKKQDLFCILLFIKGYFFTLSHEAHDPQLFSYRKKHEQKIEQKTRL